MVGGRVGAVSCGSTRREALAEVEGALAGARPPGPGGVRPRTPRGPSTSASRGWRTAWLRGPLPCGSDSQPPRTRRPGCTPAWPPLRSWPTETGSRSRRTARSRMAVPSSAGGGGRRRTVRRAGRDRGPGRAGAARGRCARHGAGRAAAHPRGHGGPDPCRRSPSAFSRRPAAASRTARAGGSRCRRPRGSGSSPSTPSGSATATGSRRLRGMRPTGACSSSGPRGSTPTWVRCRHATTR